jgi:TonB family protein
MRCPTLILLCAFGIGSMAQDSFVPARYQAGTIPPLPALAVGGGQVLLELAINRDGRVAAITPLRTTPPFTQFMADAVRDWRFSPAKEIVRQKSERGDERELQVSVETKVLVAGVFRRPAINAPTLGEPPRDTAAPSTELAFPITMTEPPFPPQAFNSGVVLVQARVERDGRISGAEIIGSAPPFDDAVRTALREWTFRPAILHAVPTPTFVYLVFGFPLPVIAQP